MISSTATDFAVDNIAVTAAPEPAASALFALGFVAIGIGPIRHKVVNALAK